MAQRACGGKVGSLSLVSLSVRMLWAAGNNTQQSGMNAEEICLTEVL